MEFKNFDKAVKEYCSFNNKAIHEVLTSLSEDELISTYYYGCSSGCATAFIHYYQTREFFESYYEEVLENLNEMKDLYGDSIFNDFTFNFNDLVWTYVEQVINDFTSWCEFEELVK